MNIYPKKLSKFKVIKKKKMQCFSYDFVIFNTGFVYQL